MKRYLYLALLTIPLTPLHPTQQLQMTSEASEMNYKKLLEQCQKEINEGHGGPYINSERMAYDRYTMARRKKSSIPWFFSVFLDMGENMYRDYLSVKRFLKKQPKKEIKTQEVVMADTAVASALVLMNIADFLFAGITGATLGTGLLMCLGGAAGAIGGGYGIWWFLNWLNIGVWLNGILSSSAGLSTIMTLGFNPVGAVGGIVVGLGSFLLQNHYNGANKISALISVYTTFQLYYFFQKRYIQPWIKKKVDEKKNKKLIKELSAFQKVKKAILTPIPK